MRVAGLARAAALAFVVVLSSAAPAAAQPLTPLAPGPATGSLATAPPPASTTDDRGPVGAVGDLLCDVVSEVDGDTADALAEVLCLLRAAELEYVTVLGEPGDRGVRRVHASAVGVPTPLDADGVPGPELTATVRLTPDRRVVLDVVKALGAPARLPVSVEVVAADPSAGAPGTARLTGGYDGREHGAPATFAATITPGERLGVDVVSAGARDSLTLVGGVFEAAADGGRDDPVSARARFAPVPATIEVGLALPSASGTRTVDADLLVDAPSTLGLDVSAVEDGDATQVRGTVTRVERTLGARVTTTDAPTAGDPGAKALDLVLDAAPGIARAGVTVTQSRDGAQRLAVDAVAEGLPLQTVARLRPRDGARPMTVDVSTSGEPIGLVDVARTTTGEPERLADDRYVLVREQGARKAVAARVRGLTRAMVKLHEQDVEVDAALGAGPFRVRIDDPETDLDASVADLPSSVALTLRPGQGVIGYRGSAPIGALDVHLHDRTATGVARSERTGVVAPYLDASVTGIPREVDAVFAPTTGDVTVHAGQGTIGGVLAHVTSSRADGLQAGNPTDLDGVTVRDLDALYGLVVRITGLQRAELSTTPSPRVLLRSASRRAVALDLQRKGAQATERIGGSIADRPSCMAFALAGGEPVRRCATGPSPRALADEPAAELDGAETSAARFAAADRFTAQDPCEADCGPGDGGGGGGGTGGGGGGGTGGGGGGGTGGGSQPPAAPVYVLYEGPGGTGRIDVELSGLPGMPARRALLLGLAGVPTGLTARLDGARDISAASLAGTIGRAEVRFTSGPRDDAVAAGHDGVVVRRTLERDVIFARVSGLRAAAISVDGARQSFGIDSLDARPFTAAVEGFYGHTTARLSQLRPGTTLTLSEDGAGQQVIGFTAKELADRFDLDTREAGGRTLHADMRPVPTSLTLCTHPRKGCGVSLLGDQDANKGTVKLKAAERVEVNYEDCKRPGKGGTCTTADEGTGFTRLRDTYLTQIAFQQWVLGSEDRTRIGFDTDGAELRADASVVDYLDPDVEQLHAHLPWGFRATRRAVEIDSTFFPTQAWKVGSIACPSETSVFVVPSSHVPPTFGLTGLLCD